MNRRQFLKIGIYAAGAAVLPNMAKAILVEENEELPNNYNAIGYIREIRVYDLRKDQYVYDYSISDGIKQFGVTLVQVNDAKADEKARKEAINLLIEDAKNELDFNNLIKLPEHIVGKTRYF